MFLALIYFTCISLAADNFKTADYLSEEIEYINDKDFQKILRFKTAEIYQLYAHNNDGEKAAEALIKAGRLYLKGSDDESLAGGFVCLATLLKNFESSAFVPEGMLLIGEIYARKKEYGRAVKTWIECAEKYPKTSEIAAQALLKAGETFKKSIKNKTEAEKQYSRIITNYFSSKVTAQALMNRAEIYAENDKYDLAVNDYLRIAREISGSETADTAMYEAIDIMENKIKDYKKAYELVMEFKQKFPNSAHLKKIERAEARLVKYANN